MKYSSSPRDIIGDFLKHRDFADMGCPSWNFGLLSGLLDTSLYFAVLSYILYLILAYMAFFITFVSYECNFLLIRFSQKIEKNALITIHI